MDTRNGDETRAAVRERYAAAALAVSGSCCSQPGADVFGAARYGFDEAGELPSDALAASLGCGNPMLLAQLELGETVLDLGSGGGIDVLLSARRVGPTGWVYGLDMTPEMLDLARRNQVEAGATNVEFLLGTIEEIPLPDATVDVIISNCVINLSADKPTVLREAFRVLRPGGRFAVSDVVLRRELPEAVNQIVGAWTGCVAGALTDREYSDYLDAAGFVDIAIEPTRVFDSNDLVGLAKDLSVPASVDVEKLVAELDGVVTSAFVRARRP